MILGIGGVVVEQLHQRGFSCSISDIGMPGMESGEARTQYKAALEALQSKDYETALAGFSSIEGRYKPLRPLVLWHKAEVYEAEGNEGKVQSTLHAMQKHYANTPIEWLALYGLGQSGVRANDDVLANETLSELVKRPRILVWP